MSENSIRKGKIALLWELLGSGGLQIISFALTIVLARLLTPEDYGTVGISMALISFIQIFMDVGFTQGIVQKKDVSKVVLNTIFVINLFISLVLSFGVYISAQVVADYFQNSALIGVLQGLSVVPVISAVSKVHGAILTKELKFKELTLISIIASVFSGAVAISAAFLEFGLFSLVMYQILIAIITTIGLWYFCIWRPSFSFSLNQTAPIFSFSFYVFIDSIFQQFFRKLDTLFIGKVFSAESLGYYSRAESLNNMLKTYVSRASGRVLFPVLSGMQEDKLKFRSTMHKSVVLMSVLSVFLVGIAYFAADWFIILILGEKWVNSIRIFKYLVFTSAFLPIRTILVQGLLAMGKSKLKMYLGFTTNIISGLSIFFGFFYGLDAFIVSVVVIRAFLLILMISITYKIFDFSFSTILEIVVPFSVIFLMVTVNYLYPINSQLIYLVGFVAVYILILFVTKNSGLNYVFNMMRNKIVKFTK